MSHLTSATIDSEDNVRSTVHENFQEEVLRGWLDFVSTAWHHLHAVFLHPLSHASALLHTLSVSAPIIACVIAHVNTRVIARVIIHTH
jgi:hypothetical protein